MVPFLISHPLHTCVHTVDASDPVLHFLGTELDALLAAFVLFVCMKTARPGSLETWS